MGLIDFFNDPNSAIIFGCGIGVSAVFLIGVTKSLYGPKMIFMMMFIAMVIVAVICFTSMAYVAIWPKKNIQHNKCHTDNVKPEQSHGHTEPHV